VRAALGTGPFGTVYRSFDREIEVDVAVKVLRPQLLDSVAMRADFLGACQQARRLSHPNLARVFHAEVEDSTGFYAMQLLEGLSLRAILDGRKEKKEPFSLVEVEPIVSQIAQALREIQRLGAHADLKPENVLLLPDLLKVTDSHLVSALGRISFVAGVGRDTAAYLAPEVRQAGPLTPAADVFSLAVITAELLCGERPRGPDFRLGAHRPELPARLDELLVRCLAPEPGGRPTSADELAALVLELTGEAGAAAARARSATTRMSRVSPAPSAATLKPAAGAALPPVRRGSTPRPAPSPDTGSGAERAATPARSSRTPRPSSAPRAQPTPPVPPPAVPLPRTYEPDLPPYEGEDVPPTVAATSPTPLPGAGATPLPRAVPVGPPPLPPRPAAADEATVAEPSRPVVLPPVTAVPMTSVPILSGSRRPVPLGVWITVILVLVGGGTWAVLHFIDQNRAGQETVIRQPLELDERNPSAEVPKVAPKAPEVPPAPAAPKPPGKMATSPDPAQKAEREKAEEAKAAAEEALEEEKGKKAKKAERKKKEAKEATARTAALAAKKEEKPQGPAVPSAPVVEPPKETLVASATVPPPEKKTCPKGMVRLKAGGFRMGSAADDPMRNFGEKRLVRVSTEEYCIDRYEYPNARGAMPLGNVTWDQAKAMCEGKGRRLCNEEEWERACKGYQGYRFPYGDEFETDKCNVKTAGGEKRPLAPAGSFADCKSGFGVFDLSGNLAEWTATPLSAGSSARIIKGGASNKPDWAVRCANRGNKPAGSRDAYLGFRCCANPE
jgi:formylglycine-generating enzyme required for sulfatase activity/serine/threonine protein kinase